MSIPSNSHIALPLLKLLEDKRKHTKNEVVEKLKKHFAITPEQWDELVPSGIRRKFDVRVLWTISKLRHAHLLKNTKIGEFKITDRGSDVLKKNPKRIDEKFLKRFPEYREFLGLERSTTDKDPNTDAEQSPLEIFEESHKKMEDSLIEEILEHVKGCIPDAFERLVVKLVVGLGYGGTVTEAGKAIGKQGDEGVDGVIKEDEFGFEKIYIQAKNQKSNVGRPKIQEFVGALEGKNARKGIFITSGGFTDDAKEYTNNLSDKKVILIDGDRLAQYMLKHDLGVSTTNIFRIKKIDPNFFEDL